MGDFSVRGLLFPPRIEFQDHMYIGLIYFAGEFFKRDQRWKEWKAVLCCCWDLWDGCGFVFSPVSFGFGCRISGGFGYVDSFQGLLS